MLICFFFQLHATRVQPPEDLFSQQVCLPSLLRPLAKQHRSQPPRMPRQRYIPLPSETPPISPPPPNPLFPIDLTQEIGAWTLEQLSTMPIPPCVMIHIHDPTTHIGDIQAHQGVQTARSIVQYVQSILRAPLTYSVYQGLSEEMKTEVRRTFFKRWNSNLDPWRRSRGCIWEAFTRGEGTGPNGIDLLLGKTVVWGINPDPISWKWVLYVAEPQ